MEDVNDVVFNLQMLQFLIIGSNEVLKFLLTRRAGRLGRLMSLFRAGGLVHFLYGLIGFHNNLLDLLKALHEMATELVIKACVKNFDQPR